MADHHHKRPHLFGMDRSVDIAGRRFGRLVALRREGVNRHRGALWLCRCDCGVERAFSSNALRTGKSTSCGCKRRETLGKHLLSRTPIYRVWAAMMARCYNPTSNRYESYAGRGITVCERWHDVEAFLEDVGEPPPGKTIERKNNSGNYEPGNVRWATPTDQARNRRSSLLIEHNGATKTLAEWCELLGLKYRTIWYRLRVANWSTARALSQR